MTEPSAVPSAAPGQGTSRRATLFKVLAVLLLLAVVVAAYWLLWGRFHVTTDNAYVGANVTQVSPLVGGTVVAVYADDTDLVEAGQVLVKLDDADARSQLDAAAAGLADAVRSVRGLYANDSQSRANVSARQSELVSAEATLSQARAELLRRESLYRNKFISREGVDTARTAMQSAQAARDAAAAAVLAARSQEVGTAGLVDNTSLAGHPRVLAAAAQVRAAYLALARCQVVAPVRGHVARRAVRVGERVAPGSALLAIVPPEQMWVDANFKEAELADLRIGQPVKLTADLYGSGVAYRGTVAGVASGTGSVFALLPPQNASGNWIRIVQRVPVRIALDARDLAAHPLRAGLSMRVTVDVHRTDGAVLASVPRKDAVWHTEVYAQQNAAADDLIARIVEQNRSTGEGAPRRR